MSVQWSNERSLRLIELYHQHRSLWDWTDPNYKNRQMKNEVWDELAEQLYISRPEVERKMKNLLCHFHREYGKVVRSKSGSAAESDVQVYDSKWFAFNALQFVKNKSKPMKLETEVDESAEEEGLFDSEELTGENWENDTPDGDLEDIGMAELTNGECECNGEGPSNYVIASNYEALGKKRLRTDVDGITSNTNGMLTDLHRDLCSAKKARDEYDGFGERVAFKLRKLKTHYAKEIVEHMINTILFEASTGKYDQPAKTNQSASSTVPLTLQHNWSVQNTKRD